MEGEYETFGEGRRERERERERKKEEREKERECMYECNHMRREVASLCATSNSDMEVLASVEEGHSRGHVTLRME